MLSVLLLGAALGIGATGCSLEPVIRGNGLVASEARSVSAFHAVTISGTGHLHPGQIGTESLTVEAESNILRKLETRSEAGRVVLGQERGTRIEPTLPIVYKLTVKDLDGLTISGSGSADATDVTSPRASHARWTAIRDTCTIRQQRVGMAATCTST